MFSPALGLIIFWKKSLKEAHDNDVIFIFSIIGILVNHIYTTYSTPNISRLPTYNIYVGHSPTVKEGAIKLLQFITKYEQQS